MEEKARKADMEETRMEAPRDGQGDPETAKAIKDGTFDWQGADGAGGEEEEATGAAAAAAAASSGGAAGQILRFFKSPGDRTNWPTMTQLVYLFVAFQVLLRVYGTMTAPIVPGRGPPGRSAPPPPPPPPPAPEPDFDGWTQEEAPEPDYDGFVDEDEPDL